MAEKADFNEDQVKAMLERSPLGTSLKRWVSIGGYKCGVKLNWITTLLAIAITWGFAIHTAVDSNAGSMYGAGKAWVSANFTWLYIGTQDVWCAFLIYLCFSRFGSIKLGADDEKPRYNNFTWFAMLFTCGVAVGLYVFGVSEPLYFYRQPTLWHSWAYDYSHTKTGIESDAMRANQAIFMAVYHWGIHGWVPYILLALTVGVVSFRWGLPMTIRTCFYPLLGDHALGLFGDIIDALSIATTTFGVCTSLGLGVAQLSSGLEYVKNINCSHKTNCVSAGGVWRLDTYGSDFCYASATSMETVAYDSCAASWLATTEAKTHSYIVIIICITLLATLSVLTGLDRGIKTLASIAFTLGTIVMLTCLYSDNTWYLLNVIVQSTGYYLQYVIQVGFDCEAFQQLSFELRPSQNHYWGTQGDEAMAAIVGGASTSGADCGNQLNPCMAGAISASVATYGMGFLKAHTFSAASETALTSIMAYHTTAFGSVRAIPCGSLSNTTHVTAESESWGYGNLDDAFCPSSLSAAQRTACEAAFAGPFPRCPETTYADVNKFGACSSHKLSCPITAAYYDDTNPEFMNWWTIFYWAWWITWAPFVGFFVAIISRGRTVREVIIGGFFFPTIFAIVWFSVFGGLAIKMERTAEIALGVKPDIGHAMVTCAEHYSGRTPITPEAKALGDKGYYMLSCMLPKDYQMYMLMEPYENRTQFIHFFLWLGLVIYFLTSSDSGSMTDDIISASGLSASLIPWWQKVFWCFTEGIVALALINAGGALKSLQYVSIVIGLPYTFFLCMLVPCCYRALKCEAGDEDIATAKKFNTQILDFLECYKPRLASPFPPAKHITCLLTGLFVPFVAIKASFGRVYPDSPISGMMYAAAAQLLWLAWVVFTALEAGGKGFYVLGWLFFTFMMFIVAFTRIEMRRIYNVWGSWMDDMFVAMFCWPWALAQLQMAAESDNKDAPTYFAEIADIKKKMGELSTSGVTVSTTSKSGSAEVSAA